MHRGFISNCARFHDELETKWLHQALQTLVSCLASNHLLLLGRPLTLWSWVRDPRWVFSQNVQFFKIASHTHIFCHPAATCICSTLIFHDPRVSNCATNKKRRPFLCMPRRCSARNLKRALYIHIYRQLAIS